jgi:hypothetical protein
MGRTRSARAAESSSAIAGEDATDLAQRATGEHRIHLAQDDRVHFAAGERPGELEQRLRAGGAAERMRPDAMAGAKRTIEEQGSGGGGDIGRRGHERTAGEDDRRCAGRQQALGDRLDHGGRDAGALAHLPEVELTEEHRQSLASLGVEMRSACGQNPREDRHPKQAELRAANEGALVGGGGGEREPRPEVVEFRPPRLRLPLGGELASHRHRGDPGVEEIGSEGQDVAGAGELEARHLVDAERELHPLAQGFVGEGLRHVVAGRPEGLDPGRLEARETAGVERREEGDPAGAGGPGARQPLPSQGERLIPRDGIEPAARPPDEWGPNPIGVVEPAERRLAAGAERAARDRMVGVALELGHPAVAVAGDDAAAGRALAAKGGVFGGDPGCGFGGGGGDGTNRSCVPRSATRLESGAEAP